MATPMSDTSIYKLTVRGIDEGQMIENIFHYRAQKKPGAVAVTASMDDMLNRFHTSWHGNVMTQLPTSYEVLQYRVVEIQGRTSNALGAKHVYGAYAEKVPPTAESLGTGVGNSLPDFVTAPIKKLTGQVGKQNRGFWQFGPLLVTYVDNNLLTAAGTAGINNFKDLFTDLVVGAAPDDALMVIYHQRAYIGTKTHAPTIPPGLSPVAASIDVDGMEAPSYVGSQKHRKLTKKFGI